MKKIVMAFSLLYAAPLLAIYPGPQSQRPKRVSPSLEQTIPDRYGTTESDQSLYADIEDAIRSSLVGRFKGNNVNFTVHDGHVTLRGHTASDEERMDIEVAVREIPGVRSVNNRIYVKTPREEQED